MNAALLHAALAFWRTRRLARRLRTRGDVAQWRDRRLKRFLTRIAPRVSAYAHLQPQRLEDLPIFDKATLMSRFDAYNTAGVTLAETRAVLDAGQDRVRGLIVGQSTGTSGNRGVFIISEVERFTWLGVILAKTLPDALTHRHRVALALPSYSTLYDSAAASGRLQIRFFDLAKGVDAWRSEIAAYDPDTIVAPPKVLRELAESTSLRPANVFSGAEVLDLIDRRIVEDRFGGKVREIYMATEGLFGVACPRGLLHLAEDVVAFEWESAPSGLSMPIITDFTRTTQIMARYRMNDLLRLSQTPCACGSPLQAVEAVEGRQDDLFRMQGAFGLVLVTPDVLRNAIVDADRRILDFRVVQTAADRIELALAAELPEEAFASARAAMQAALERLGVVAITIESKRGIAPSFDRKLRRVRCDWRPK